MLGRTAQNLFWLSRHIERAENMARLLEVGLPHEPHPDTRGAPRAIALDDAGRRGRRGFAKKHGDAVASVSQFMLFDETNPSSVRSCLLAARTNARSVRTALTADMWEALNAAWLEFAAIDPREITGGRLLELLDWVRERTRYRGALLSTILRDDGYAFSQIGNFVERADNTARILDMKYYVLLPRTDLIGGDVDIQQWTMILRAASAHRTYRHVYHDRYRAWNIADYLILRPEMPRSLRFCYDWLRPRSRALPALRQARALGRSRRRDARMLTTQHGHDLPGRPARVPDRFHRAQQPAHRGDLGRLQFRLSRCASRSATRRTTPTTRRLVRRAAAAADAGRQHGAESAVLDDRGGRASSMRREYVDGFGNRVHLITHSKPYEELTITASGEVETIDRAACSAISARRPIRSLFLRATPLTASSASIDALADGLPGAEKCSTRLHHLLEAIAARVAYVTDATDAATSAAEAFEAGQGVCQDHAHIFIAAARKLGVPARYVTGYLHVEGERSAVANHAWAEAWIAGSRLGRVRPGEPYLPDRALCPARLRLRRGLGGAGHRHAARRRRGGADG